MDKKFNNKRAVLNAYFKSLVDAPNARESVDSVKSLLDTIQENTQAIKALGLGPEEILQTLFNFLLMRKLSDELRSRYENSLGNSRDIQTLDPLLKFLEHEYFALEASGKVPIY